MLPEWIFTLYSSIKLGKNASSIKDLYEDKKGRGILSRPNILIPLLSVKTIASH